MPFDVISYILAKKALKRAKEVTDNIIVDAPLSRLVEAVNAQTDNDYLSELFAYVFNPRKCFEILSDPEISADKAQAILYGVAERLAVGKLIGILTHNAPDVTLTANATYSGLQRFNKLDLAGYTYTADGEPHIIVARKLLTSAGSIVKTPTGGAKGDGHQNGGYGGQGGGGLIILAEEAIIDGVVSADGEKGQDGLSTPTARVGGGKGGDGLMTVLSGDSPGNGGRGGSNTLDAYYAPGGTPGGGGGGSGQDNIANVLKGGAGGTVSLATYDSVTELLKDVLKFIVDQWLINVLGKTPSTTKPIGFYGAGGGGAADGLWGEGGGGGGSGGEIVAIVLDGEITGSLTAKGGDGGAYQGGIDSGGGGGGGVIYLLYNYATVSPTFDVSGGQPGPTLTRAPAAGTEGVGKSIKINRME